MYMLLISYNIYIITRYFNINNMYDSYSLDDI